MSEPVSTEEEAKAARDAADDQGADEAAADETSKPRLSPQALRGRRVAQVLFFGTVVWIILAFSVEVVGDGLFRAKVPRSSQECRAQLDVLRNKFEDAEFHDRPKGELEAVGAFRESLSLAPGSHDLARSWDNLAFELVDGCPATEASVAYALGRLRATQEATVRTDALDAEPARRAYKKAMEPLQTSTAHDAIPAPPPRSP